MIPATVREPLGICFLFLVGCASTPPEPVAVVQNSAPTVPVASASGRPSHAKGGLPCGDAMCSGDTPFCRLDGTCGNRAKGGPMTECHHAGHCADGLFCCAGTFPRCASDLEACLAAGDTPAVGCRNVEDCKAAGDEHSVACVQREKGSPIKVCVSDAMRKAIEEN